MGEEEELEVEEEGGSKYIHVASFTLSLFV